VAYTERFSWREKGLAECQDARERSSTLFRYSAEAGAKEILVANATEFRLEGPKKAREIKAPLDLLGLSLVPCSEPIEKRVAAAQPLTLQLLGKDVSGLPSTGRQEVRTAADKASAVVRLHAHSTLGRAASFAQIAEARQANAQLPLQDPRLSALAEQAIGHATSAEEKVKRLLKFVAEYVQDDANAEPLGLMDLIRQRRGDCTEHALLFTALARSAGIPCREVTGLLYLGDAEQKFGGHAWNEVVLNGAWHEVDPTWNLFQVTTGHILLSSGKSGPKDLRFLAGGLRLEVLAEASH
jgi:hypothetical protein